MGKDITSPFKTYKELSDAYDEMTERKFEESDKEYEG